MKNFVDKHGRYHDKPIVGDRPYSCNNAFLYTAYAHLLGLPVNLNSVAKCWADCRTIYGYNRHPDGDILPASSHDEVVGIFMMFYPRHTHEEFSLDGWQVCNQPGFSPRNWYTLNPFKVIRDFWNLSREKREDGTSDSRRATIKYPYIWPIVFKHQSQHIYFYDRCMGERTSLTQNLWFLIASSFTILFGSNSGRVMLGFKLKHLSKLGANCAERLITKLYDSRLNFYGEVFGYFADKENPIAIRAKEMLDITGGP